MSSPALNFKEQVTEARRTQILQGAAQVFAQKGFHKATTKEIAQAAGVAEGTIYNYFSNKRELLIAMVHKWATQSFEHIILDSPPADPREFLTLLLHNRFTLLQEQGHILAPLIAELFSDVALRNEIYQQIVMPLTSLIEQRLASLAQSGQFRPLNPMIVTRAIVGALVLNAGIKVTGIDARYDDITPDAMITEITSLLLDGLLADV